MLFVAPEETEGPPVISLSYIVGNVGTRFWKAVH